MELEKSLGNGKIRTLCWRNIMSPKDHILTNKGKLLRTVMLTSFPSKKTQIISIHTCTTYQSRVRSLQGNLRPRLLSIDWAIVRSIHQSRDFPVMTKRMRFIYKFFIIIMAFSLRTRVHNQLKPTTGQRITLKNMSPQSVVHLSSQNR